MQQCLKFSNFGWGRAGNDGIPSRQRNFIPQVLSQISLSPISRGRIGEISPCKSNFSTGGNFEAKCVERRIWHLTRAFERGTRGGDRRSDVLYRPICKVTFRKYNLEESTVSSERAPYYSFNYNANSGSRLLASCKFTKHT